MSMTPSDLLDVVADQLKRAGYTFHSEGTPVHLQAPGFIEAERHWFTWTDGVDSETSEDFSGSIEAQAGALEHHFALAWAYMGP